MKNTLKNKKLFIFDQDGTIYLGGKVFPFAVEFINNLRNNGYKVLFLQITPHITQSTILISSHVLDLSQARTRYLRRET